jgi:hypothetical protein
VMTQNQSLIKREMKISNFNSSITLQILQDAIIFKYKLTVKEPMKKWIVKLQKDKIPTLPLTHIFDMIHARIPVWEQAVEDIPAQQVAHDSWVEGVPGRRAGYYAHASLCDIVGEKIFKEILIKDTTFDVAQTLYQRIQIAVQVETETLLAIKNSLATDKAKAITKAMERLWREINKRYNNPGSENGVDLYSIDTMLDAQLGKEESDSCFSETSMSVRQALNLSRSNPFSLFGLQPPLWGKAASLIHVEKNVGSLKSQ